MHFSAALAKYYDAESKTLNLNAAVFGLDLAMVLEKIEMDAPSCFYEMETLILSNNQFDNYDTDRLPKFPPNLKSLDLSNNQLSQITDWFLWNLFPANFESLHLQNNCLEGDLNWHQLPDKLRSLWIFGNEFDGVVEWDQLPKDLSVLYISKYMADNPVDSMPKGEWHRYDDNFKTLFTKFTIEPPSSTDEMLIDVKRASTVDIALLIVLSSIILWIVWYNIDKNIEVNL